MRSPAKEHRARGPEDYWRLGPVYVQKQLVPLAVIGLSVAVLTIFGLPFPRPAQAENQIPAYRWNDPELEGISGLVQVLDDAGRVRYEGEVSGGAYTGLGKVFDRAGELRYDGPLVDGVYEGPDAKVYRSGVLVYTGEMAGNQYEGQGRRTDPETGVVSQGPFSGGRLEGWGQEFYAGGALMREGTFSRDLLEGEGCEYSADGVLLREGTFSSGLLHGEGKEYTASGKLRYEGQFWRGIYHGEGTVYDTLLGVRSASGTFVYGQLSGQGSIYHPSGQLLYTGQVWGERPRADAFLGLSLAEVEGAFTAHWLLYSCGDVTAFVYPYFHLMFITESPIDLVSPAQMAAESAQLPAYHDEQLAADTDKRDVLITQVLSYGDALACVAQPNYDFVSGRHPPGWREWFSDFASGELVQGALVRQSGVFIWRFTPQGEAQADGWIDEFLAENAGVETMTVRKEDKDMTLWYQTARWRDGP